MQGGSCPSNQYLRSSEASPDGWKEKLTVVQVHWNFSVYHQELWSCVGSSQMLKGPGLLTLTPTKCCMWTTYAKEITMGKAAPFRQKNNSYRERVNYKLSAVNNLGSQ